MYFSDEIESFGHILQEEQMKVMSRLCVHVYTHARTHTHTHTHTHTNIIISKVLIQYTEVVMYKSN